MTKALRVLLWITVCVAANVFLNEIAQVSPANGFLCGLISGLAATGLLSLLE